MGHSAGRFARARVRSGESRGAAGGGNRQGPAGEKGVRLLLSHHLVSAQHILEVAYFTTVEGYPIEKPSYPNQLPPGKIPDEGNNNIEKPEPPPIGARIAGWSRLVFHVPDEKLPIDWEIESLLIAIKELKLSVPANAQRPRPKRSGFLSDLLVSTVKEAGVLQLAAAGGSQGAAGLEVLVGLSLGETLPPPVAGATRVLAGVRSRRKLRTIGHLLGLTNETGAATRNFAKVVPSALFESDFTRILQRPVPAPPGLTQTALELPFRIILSPNDSAAWFHREAATASEATGHIELWHTRLGARHDDGTLFDGADPLRTLRAVWTTEQPPPITPLPDQPVKNPPHSNTDPFRASLDGFDRHNVVQLSSNFRLIDGKNPNSYHEPEPLQVEHLLLSSLGAWLDSRGAWDYPQPAGLSVEEWRHRATLGRDHYVRVVYAGFLCPWGHRASVVKITERQFHDDTAANTAYLRQRMFLLVREPVKTYRQSGLQYDGPDPKRKGEQYNLMMPFEAVRILNLVSPLIDPPETDDIQGLMQSCFWPYVGGEPFKFHLVGADTDGNQVDMVMPLIFVGKEETDRAYANSILPKLPSNFANAYEKADWPVGSKNLRATVPINGQKVAFAKSKAPEDTSLAVQSITFGAEVPSQKKFDQLGWRVVRFFPVVRKAQVSVPALQRIARTTTPPSLVYQSLYLREGFSANNGGEVFLAADPATSKLSVPFSSQGDRSGGLITPDLQLSGISRVIGPVSGDIGLAAAGTFDPASWFGAITGAKLFGVLSLKDILAGVGFNDIDKLPQFVGQNLNQVEQVISGLERLQKITGINSASEIAAIKSLLDQLLNATTGSIPTLLHGGGTGAVATQLFNLKSELAALAPSLPGSALPSGVKTLLTQISASLSGPLDAVLSDLGLLQKFAQGDILPQSLQARFEWRPLLKGSGPFKPNDTRGLVLSVEASEGQTGGKEAFSVTCALDDFVLDLEILILKFERVQIQALAGKKMDVDVKFGGFEFAGPLSFIETLRNLIPIDGFSDPPDVQVTPAGIAAGFTAALPNIAFGVFSLENLSLGAGFEVPFIGKPLSTWFQFCTRENPSRLTVSLFGGGFFIGLKMDASGLQLFEGAIEFGAAISVNFGVASGSVSAMAGLYFKIEGSDYTLAGYFRLRGEVEALGIVSVCIELYLEMLYESGSHKCIGTATISVEIDVALFSTTIKISCTKTFAGAGPDPTLAELYDVQPDATSEDWNTYCAAFA